MSFQYRRKGLRVAFEKAIGGFTIVELLIVIVVIAILASVTIVAYSGIQRQARNSVIISSAGEVVKMIALYKAQEGSYPISSTYACVTTTSGCIEPTGTVRAAHATFDANIAKVGSLPRSVPSSGDKGIGIIYNSDVNRAIDGQSRPAMIAYYLEGLGQDCGQAMVMTAWGTVGQESSISTTGYYRNDTATNKTICWVSLD